MPETFDELARQVAQNPSVEGSAAILVRGIAARIAQARAGGTDRPLDDLIGGLEAAADALSYAVAQNTAAAASTDAGGDSEA
ncbi:hypothetical protein [Methylobacterium gnaphalii]|uniref:Uncharacterized protein n=1 Tax=Methylobacterium gnaphalii TaxID=1010610 RepID=A0A512JJ09_9HYPH|nr:hypothetical protein [Methylobacterium gnaphalii]GEP09924.1 hypothetical protein MGN01_17690 [Methylobacterium gnaphalii]GJD68300.1 hypothetical protein MMMDOFMJ_1219 [Methylobacterium gnaphalii]GLS51780.1 hypothetical protein GCM10007885_46410 [Methylobacterium gnaphalii]